MKVACVVLLALVAVAVAQNPSVNGGTTALTQNHGYITITGRGFETDLPTSGNVGTATAQFQFGRLLTNFQPGCIDGTMTISAGGSTMTCMFLYIPDGAIAVGGSPLMLTVVNANGASTATQIRTVTRVPTTITGCATTPCTVQVRTTATGLCFAGNGFPALGSIPLATVQADKAAATFVLSLDDDVAGGAVSANVHDHTVCVYTKTNICCRIPSIAAFQDTDTLTASLLYTSGAHTTNWAGAGLAVLTTTALPAPTVTASPAIAQNQRLLTITGTNFENGPAVWSNVVTLSNGRTCTVLQVNTARTQLVCAIFQGYAGGAAELALYTTIDVSVNGVAAAQFTPPAATAVAQRIVADNQQISRNGGVLRIPAQGLPPSYRTIGAGNAREFTDAATDLQVTLQTDAGAAIATCQIEPGTGNVDGVNSHVPFVSTVASADACVVTNVGPNFIEVTYGSSIFANHPVGTQVTAGMPVSAGVIPVVLPQVVIGTVTAAGVGGDPHFFGFLGERYEFAGEAGQVYNILTDENVQINALMGNWHYTHGKETVIKSLAIKVAGSNVVIDAGGNQFGSEGFSLRVNGVAVAPNATLRHSLGSSGYVRWYQLTDEFKVPIWSHHHAVAKVDVVLDDYALEIFSIEEGKDEQGVWHRHPSRFLDFLCDMFDTTRRPHGLFGQSAHLPRGKRSIEGWSIEGEASDYQVKGNSLLGDDFTFNKFKV